MSAATVRAVLAVLLSFAMALPAWAEPSDRARASRLFRSAEDHFKRGEMLKALEQFTAAYALDPEPVMLINIAQCHRALGRRREAIAHYEKFLEAAPKHPLASAVRVTLAELGPATSEPPPPAAPAAPPPAPAAALVPPAAQVTQPLAAASPPPAAASPPSPWPWVGGAAGVVALAVGAGLVLHFTVGSGRSAQPLAVIQLPPP